MKTEQQKKMAKLVQEARKRKALTPESVGEGVPARDRFKVLDKLPAPKLPKDFPTSKQLLADAKDTHEDKAKTARPRARAAVRKIAKPIKKRIAMAATA